MYGSNVVTTQAGANVGATNQAVGQNMGGAQSLFTQEQVNSIVAGRVNELNQKIVELTNANAQLQATSNRYATELNTLRAESVLIREGVNPQMKDYVAFEVNKRAVNGKSFETALQEFKSANGHMFTNTANTAQNGQTTAQQGVASTVGGAVGIQQATQNVSLMQGVSGVATGGATGQLGTQPDGVISVGAGVANTANMAQAGQQMASASQVGQAVVQPVGVATGGVQNNQAVVGSTSAGGAINSAVVGFDMNGFIKQKTKINL